MARSERGGVFYGWVVVGVTVMVLLVSAGIRAAPGVLILPLEQDTGWSRSLLSFAVSMGLLLFGFAGPLAGWLVDRFGPRAVMLSGLVLMCAAMLASAVMREVWQLVLFWGALSGIGTGLAGAVLGTTIATRWFVERRGMVLGVFGASTSAGQLIFLPAIVGLVALIQWRGATLVLAGAAVVLLPLVWFLMRDSPADVGATPLGLSYEPPPAPNPPGGVMAAALRSPTFWLLAGTFFICGATSNGLIGTHLVAYAVEVGMTPATAASALALMGIMNFLGTLGSGWLTDRYDPRILLACYYGFRGLSLLFLPFVGEPFSLAFFAVVFGLDYIATVPPTSALVADAFGRRNVGTVFGWVFCSHQIGAALAAWLGGISRDMLGSYTLAFLVAGGLAVAAAALATRIKRQPVTA
ncbi:MAG: MFS transporter [Oscillochloris sp.]|nr:MFS transporter [Oscillochloris sp.]